MSYVIFSLFFLLGYLECGLVKLTRVNLHFLTQCFFYLTLVFFCYAFFWKSNFFLILISFCEWRIGWVNQGWLRFFSSIFLWLLLFLISWFCIKLFSLSFVIVLLFFLFCYFEGGLVKLTRVSLNFFLNVFFNLTLVFSVRFFFWKSNFFYLDLMSRVTG